MLDFTALDPNAIVPPFDERFKRQRAVRIEKHWDAAEAEGLVKAIGPVSAAAGAERIVAAEDVVAKLAKRAAPVLVLFLFGNQQCAVQKMLPQLQIFAQPGAAGDYAQGLVTRPFGFAACDTNAAAAEKSFRSGPREQTPIHHLAQGALERKSSHLGQGR